jgi:hypothetical protein
MVEHFINAALSKSWIEAQLLFPLLSVSGRGTETAIKRAPISLGLACKGMPEVNKMAFRFSTHTLPVSGFVIFMPILPPCIDILV